MKDMNKNKEFPIICVSIGLICMVLSFGIISFANAQEKKETIELTAATIFSPKHRIKLDAFDIYDKEITKRTNGRIKIKWFHASSLVKAAEAHGALLSGLVDLTQVPISNMPHLFPISNGLGLPFIVDSSVHAADMAPEMWQKIPEMQQEYSNLRFLGLLTSDVADLHLKDKRVRKIEDLEGLRIATTWTTLLKALRLLPCKTEQSPPEEIYMMLKKKVDGIMYANAPLKTRKLMEVVRYHTVGKFGVMPVAWCMAKATYEKLPSDIKKVFDDLNPSLTRLMALCGTNEGLYVMEAMKKRGDVFDYLPPEELARWKKRMRPTYDAWIADLNQRGFNGHEIFEKMEAISEKKRKNPVKIDEWWKQGKMGKFD